MSAREFTRKGVERFLSETKTAIFAIQKEIKTKTDLNYCLHEDLESATKLEAIKIKAEIKRNIELRHDLKLQLECYQQIEKALSNLLACKSTAHKTIILLD